MGSKICLNYEIRDIDLNIEVGIFPKDPVLKYKFVIKNSGENEINIDSIRIKVHLLGIMDMSYKENIVVPSIGEIEIEIEKKLSNLIDFGNSIFNYYIKPSEKSKYKIRGLAKIDGEFHRVKGSYL